MPRPITSFEAHVLTSDHRPGQKFVFTCPNGEAYSRELIDHTLAALLLKLDEVFPGNSFDIKKLSRRKYNVVPVLIHTV